MVAADLQAARREALDQIDGNGCFNMK